MTPPRVVRGSDCPNLKIYNWDTQVTPIEVRVVRLSEFNIINNRDTPGDTYGSCSAALSGKSVPVSRQCTPRTLTTCGGRPSGNIRHQVSVSYIFACRWKTWPVGRCPDCRLRDTLSGTLGRRWGNGRLPLSAKCDPPGTPEWPNILGSSTPGTPSGGHPSKVAERTPGDIMDASLEVSLGCQITWPTIWGNSGHLNQHADLNDNSVMRSHRNIDCPICFDYFNMPETSTPISRHSCGNFRHFLHGIWAQMDRSQWNMKYPTITITT